VCQSAVHSEIRFAPIRATHKITYAQVYDLYVFFICVCLCSVALVVAHMRVNATITRCVQTGIKAKRGVRLPAGRCAPSHATRIWFLVATSSIGGLQAETA
jgi:hypothetical protein